MRRRDLEQLEEELECFLDELIGGEHLPRQRSMKLYVTGLLLDGERKSIEPMAGRLVDKSAAIQSMRQRLQECVSISTWSDDKMFCRLTGLFERELPSIEAFVIDDTGFPKKGAHSVGVARQYSGTLGRIDNCQIATSLHLAGEGTSGCIGFRLYLPESWASDHKRRRKTGVPDEVSFREKWKVALDLLDAALAAGARRHVVLADSAYGDTGEFREGLVERGLSYVVSVKGETVVWPPAARPAIRPRKPGKPGRPPTRSRDERHPPVSLAQLASTLTFRKVSWREGSRDWQSSRFAAARIRTAHRHQNGKPPGNEQWVLCQWPDGEEAPTKYWLSTLPPDTSVRTLVRFAKLRWRIERDYQELKQELGLDHFEGRSWRGFHHHATLCAVAHGFLALRRALFPPEQDQVDLTDGAQSSSAGHSPTDRLLPPLPTPSRPRRATARSVEDLENAIR
jgi:SRSO17 transposase